MPHTHDKVAIRAAQEILGIPSHVFRRVCDRGRITLDTAHPGQQQFQALLFDCFFSGEEQHPWDRMVGRSFRHLINYFSWVAPQPDRLIIRTNTAFRIASYLLPYTRVFDDGSYEHSGIAGLRVEAFSPDTIHLRHLPTGGALDLQDTSPSRSARLLRSCLRSELECRAESESDYGRYPAHESPELAAAEEAASTYWASAASRLLRSALMARSYLWWYTLRHGAVVLSARRSNATCCLRWFEGRSSEQLGELLSSGPLCIPGVKFTPRTREFDASLIRLGDAAIELATPLLPRGEVLPWHQLSAAEREEQDREDKELHAQMTAGQPSATA